MRNGDHHSTAGIHSTLSNYSISLFLRLDRELSPETANDLFEDSAPTESDASLDAILNGIAILTGSLLSTIRTHSLNRGVPCPLHVCRFWGLLIWPVSIFRSLSRRELLAISRPAEDISHAHNAPSHATNGDKCCNDFHEQEYSDRHQHSWHKHAVQHQMSPQPG